MENKYKVITNYIEIEGSIVETYGVCCEDENIKPIYDISTDKEKVEQLIKMMNENDCDPIHMLDVCEDAVVI